MANGEELLYRVRKANEVELGLSITRSPCRSNSQGSCLQFPNDCVGRVPRNHLGVMKHQKLFCRVLPAIQ